MCVCSLHDKIRCWTQAIDAVEHRLNNRRTTTRNILNEIIASDGEKIPDDIRNNNKLFPFFQTEYHGDCA